MRKGSAEITGLGYAEWSMMILVVKLALWAGWATLNANTEKTRQRMFSTVSNDLRITPPAYSFWQSAYGAILLCAWLLADLTARWSTMSSFMGRSSQRVPAPLAHATPLQREWVRRFFILDKPAWIFGRRTSVRVQYQDLPIRYAPPVESLKHLADIAVDPAVRDRITALLRLREGRTVMEVVGETGLPMRTLYRWWRKYRPDRFNNDDRPVQSATPSIPTWAKRVRGCWTSVRSFLENDIGDATQYSAEA